MGRGCMFLFFGVFFVVGAAMTWFMTVRPVLRIVEARSWPEVPCTVTSSQVQSHSDSDGTTYSIEVTYSYEIDGREYTGDRYDFSVGSSSGYQGKAEIVERHPPGSETVCRVDPEDPQRSVMSVGFRLEYLWGLFPLPFLLVGVGGLMWVIFQPGSRGREGPGWLPRSRPEEDEGKTVPGLWAPSATGPLTLSSGNRPVWRFLFTLVIALVWNSMVGLLLLPATQEGGCVWIGFLVLFGGVGLLFLAGVPYTFLAIFNPRPTLTLDRSELAVGESCRLSWSWSGASKRIERLRIVLEGCEEATYTRGTDTRTDRHVFARIEVVDTDQPIDIARGNGTLAIPADTMHSFEAPRNKIVWSLGVAAEIPRWPDVGETHKLVIHPRKETS